MQCLPKANNATEGYRFIVAYKQGRTKPQTKTFSSILKMIYSHEESFHKKSHFCSNFKKF